MARFVVLCHIRMSPLIKGFFAYPPSCHAGHEGVKELRRIEQTLAGCLKNLRFIDSRSATEIFPDLRLIICLKIASTNQRLHIALFTEF
jgi:hypothetical protein